MTNRLLRTFCAAWLGLAFTACEAVDDTGMADDITTEGHGRSGDIQSALSNLPSARVVDSHADGVPYFIKGELGRASATVSGLSARAAHEGASEALRNIAPVFRLRAEDLVLKRMRVNDDGTQHLRYTQTLNGYEVKGGELILHVDAAGNVFAANSSARGALGRVSSKARISSDAAVQVARTTSEARDAAVEGPTRLVYWRDEARGLRLAHEVRVKGEGAELPVDEWVLVDAEDGVVLLRDSNIHAARNRAVYSANNGSSLPGTLKRSEGQAATGDAHVDMNYEHLGTTYDCYKEVFGRDSFNNAGAQLRSTVHYGSRYVNAFWNGSQMVYGDGDGVTAIELGKDLDVTVHELTHAVTDYESDLVYAYESGALNEAWSDIFAAVCESWARPVSWAIDDDIWLIGEDVWTPGTAGDALRYMANPTIDGSSRDYYPTRYTGSSDNGGVHWNSGIANLAFHLLVVGGSHPRGVTSTVVPGIGMEAAARIFYKANTDYFTSSTNFAQAKTGTEQAATALGYDAATVAAVGKAWEAVGVGGGSTPPPDTVVTLQDGVAVTGLSDSSGGQKFYKLTVPAGQSSLKFTMSGGSGDADLYVRFGSQPTTSTYECRPYRAGNSEECTFNNPSAGDWYVMVRGYSSYSGVSLVGDYATAGGGGGGNVLTNGVATAPYSGASGTWTCWTLDVPSGRSSVVFNQAGGTGDADLYVRFGAQPTTSSYDCRPYQYGNSESCSFSNPSAGTWYACSRAYSAYSNTTMKGTY